MKLLVLGGSEFVGRAVVEEGIRRGWAVTTLNRGRRPAVPGVREVHGDRRETDGLRAVLQEAWDLVVDTWSAEPIVVDRSARALASRAGRYAYISSRSVYRFPVAAGAAEDAPVVHGSPDDETSEDYARAKRGGELAVTSAFGDRALLARPGLILGPHENVGRLPWWLQRIARGGAVVAPGPADLGVQVIDARDLASFVLDGAAAGLAGAFNLTTPEGAVTMGEVLETCVRVTGSDARLHWVTPEAIAEAGAAPWTQLPMWVPPGELHDMIHRGDVTRALQAGLRCRPVAETVRDTWAWLQAAGGSVPVKEGRPAVGLPEELEAAILRGAAR